MTVFCMWQAPPAHYHLPYVAVKRLTLPQSAPPRSKVRNSVLMAEIDRINHRVRPALGFSAVEHYLNSRLALVRGPRSAAAACLPPAARRPRPCSARVHWSMLTRCSQAHSDTHSDTHPDTHSDTHLDTHLDTHSDTHLHTTRISHSATRQSNTG